MRVPDWANVPGWVTQSNFFKKEQKKEHNAVASDSAAVESGEAETAPFELQAAEPREKIQRSTQRGTDGKKQPLSPERENMLSAFRTNWDLNQLKYRNALQKEHNGNGISAERDSRGGPSQTSGPGSFGQVKDTIRSKGETMIDRFREASIFSYDHSLRVGALAGDLAKRIEGTMGVEPGQNVSDYYNNIGKFHDIGKYAIPFEILEKPGKLTPEETQVVRSHPLVGESMLKATDEFNGILPAVRHHHERWDGQGYPDGLKGEQIPLDARIISIADSYDAIISDRPYRKGSQPEAALAEIERCSGTQFDPQLVNEFGSMIRELLGRSPTRFLE